MQPSGQLHVRQGQELVLPVSAAQPQKQIAAIPAAGKLTARSRGAGGGSCDQLWAGREECLLARRRDQEDLGWTQGGYN